MPGYVDTYVILFDAASSHCYRSHIKYTSLCYQTIYTRQNDLEKSFELPETNSAETNKIIVP